MTTTPISGTTHLASNAASAEVPVNEMADVGERMANSTKEWTVAGDFTCTQAQFSEGFMHELGGVPAGAFAFGVYPVARFFAVKNASGKTCTVYVQGLSGSGVSIADTETILLYSDGVNISEVGGGAAVVASGSIYPDFTTPVLGDFTAINSASGITNANGGVYLSAPANSGDSLRIYKKAAPATPYTITACMLVNLVAVDFQAAGICFRQSSDGKLVTMCFTTGNTLPADYEYQCADWTSPTAFSAANATVDVFAGSLIWLRITDNGTNRIVSWSVDGYNFHTLFTEGRTTFLTADEVGFYANTSTALWPASLTLLSWRVT